MSSRREGRRARAERGFTLIEMMIVVAVIAILAIVVVPQFFKESSKTKSGSEVAAFFAEIATKQEQYRSDTGGYLTMDACPGTVPSAAGVDAQTACGGSAQWTTVNVHPPTSTMRCQYRVEAGATGDSPTAVPPEFSTQFTAPTTQPWFYVVAICDGDNSSTTNAMYFTSSIDSATLKANEGH